MARVRSRREVLRFVGLSCCVLPGCAEIAAHGSDVDSTEPSVATGPTPVSSPPQTETPTGQLTSPTGAERDQTATGPAAIERPAGSIAGAPLPATTGAHRYATMGPAESGPTAVLFGSWKCPYTRAFVVDQLDGIVDTFVRPGHVAIQYRNVAYRAGEPFLGPDAPLAGRAGLGIWNAEPAAFWSYFAYVFANQPPEREEWATADTVADFAATAGVRRLDRLRQAIGEGAYEAELVDSVAVARELGVSAVPRVVLDGTVTAPTVDPESTWALLERAASG